MNLVRKDWHSVSDTREKFIHKIMDEVKKHMDDAGIEATGRRPCETFLQHL